MVFGRRLGSNGSHELMYLGSCHDSSMAFEVNLLVKVGYRSELELWCFKTGLNLGEQ